MRRLPFHKEFDSLFQGNRSIWFKIGGGALVGILLGGFAMLKEGKKLADSVQVGIVIGTALIGAIVGLVLATKDIVRQRQENGQSVNPLLSRIFSSTAMLMVILVVGAFGFAILFVMLLAAGIVS